MNWIMILGIVVGLVVLLLVVAVVAAGFLFCGDVMSYTAPGSETLSPAGASAGQALVVYNPGISGAAKSAAATIASDLQSQGYTVKLAGIKSKEAADISGYDVIIAGGPMYWGRVSNSVEAYVKALQPQKNVSLGVFATTGSAGFNDGDIATFGGQIAALPCCGTLSKPAATKTIRTGDAGNTDCSALVSAVRHREG